MTFIQEQMQLIARLNAQEGGNGRMVKSNQVKFAEQLKKLAIPKENAAHQIPPFRLQSKMYRVNNVFTKENNSFFIDSYFC